MALALDASTPAGLTHTYNASGDTPETTASNSFSPPAGSMIVVVTSTNFAFHGLVGATTTITDSLGSHLTWTKAKEQNLTADYGVVTLWWAPCPSAQTSMTVSVTYTAPSTQYITSVQVTPLVFTGAKTASPIGTITAGFTASALSNAVSITPTAIGSALYIGSSACVSAAASGTTTAGSGCALKFQGGLDGTGSVVNWGASSSAPSLTTTLVAQTLNTTESVAATWMYIAFEVLAGAAASTAVPPVTVQSTHQRRRGISKFLAGPVNPVPVPRIDKVQRFPLRLRGTSKFLKGPITPVPQVPVTVVATHQRRPGRVLFLKGPVNPVPEPNVTVVATHRRRRGIVAYLRGTTPAPIIPPNVTVVTPTHTKRRGIARFLAGPVNPVPQVPVTVVATHQRRRGRALFLRGPVNPVPVPPVVVQSTHQRRRGLLRYLRGTVPTGFTPVPSVTVVTPTHTRRRGISKFLRGPVNPVPVPPVTVKATHQRRLGRLVYRRGTVPVVFTPLPHVTVVTPTHTRRRGILRYLRGPVNPVPVPRIKVVTPTHTPRRGLLRYLRGLVGVTPPPPIPVIPTEFTARSPAPYWTAGDSRTWWAPGEPRSSRWEPGEPLVGWSASQALLEPLSEAEVVANLLGGIYGAGVYGSGLYGIGVPGPVLEVVTSQGVDAQSPAPDWQTGEPRS